MAFTIDNPRFIPGSISGRGMDYTPDGRVVDTRFAVHLDSVDGCLIEYPGPGNPTYALALGGSVTGTEDRIRSLFLVAPEGAGFLIERLVSLASMIGPEFRQALLDSIASLTPPLPEDPTVTAPMPVLDEEGPESLSEEKRAA
jgi:hypothetical protein